MAEIEEIWPRRGDTARDQVKAWYMLAVSPRLGAFGFPSRKPREYSIFCPERACGAAKEKKEGKGFWASNARSKSASRKIRAIFSTDCGLRSPISDL